MKGKIKYLIVLGIILMIVVFLMSKPAIHLKKPSFVYEYGQSLSHQIEEYVDFEKYTSQQIKDILQNSQLFMDIPNEKQHNYPAIGEYYAYITYRHKETSFQIIVKDTTHLFSSRIQKK